MRGRSPLRRYLLRKYAPTPISVLQFKPSYYDIIIFTSLSLAIRLDDDYFGW